MGCGERVVISTLSSPVLGAGNMHEHCILLSSSFPGDKDHDTCKVVVEG